jgi:Ni,Fe-hydrogenase III small subunit
MGRFGIQVVASPRHADCILITGPVSRNMLQALKKTYEAVPAPAFVIACGSCAISGGIFEGSPEVCNGADDIFKVDLYVPGCPPHPATLLEALLRFIGKNPRKLS